jgi:hypothetical protein
MRTCASILLILTAACGDHFDSGQPEPDSGTPDNNVGGGDAQVPPGCDKSKLPADDICVINDAQGVFVSSSKGSAAGDGTKAHPMLSLEAAITKAQPKGLRVYACAETYAEQIHLQNGVSVFGYFDCSDWSVSKTAHAKVAAPASPAASASNITTPTRVEAVDIVSPDFTDKSQSSIALFANNAPALTITHATVHAGTGGKGADGTVGIQLNDSGSKNGGDAWKDGVCTASNCTLILSLNTSQTTGGSNACVGEAGHDPGAGGAGGKPGEYQSGFFVNGYIWNVVNNDNTTGGFPTTPTAQTAQGGSVGVGGSTGAAGTSGKDGVSGSDFGVITSSGYTTSDGTTGTAGQPGQGGGGSGGYNGLTADGYAPASYQNKYAWGEAGAAGGAGGCPGLAGQVGKGGGASIAIVALGGAFTLDTVMVEASKGGDGGMSGAPSAPTAGGSGGHAAVLSPGGGNGGAGGDAGVSGNGGGGPSLGITFDKTKPTMLACTVKQGAGGSGVTKTPASDNGLSLDVYMFGQ